MLDKRCRWCAAVDCRRAHGGIAESENKLDLYGQHGVTPEVLQIQDSNEANERRFKCDDKYRFVMNVAKAKSRPDHRPSRIPA